LLVYWRERAAAEGLTPALETATMKMWATLSEHPDAFGMAADAVGALPLDAVGRRLPVVRGWMGERAAPQPSRERFLRTWSRKEEGR
jgi:L-lactate dehydrogenase complex protein LldF